VSLPAPAVPRDAPAEVLDLDARRHARPLEFEDLDDVSTRMDDLDEPPPVRRLTPLELLRSSPAVPDLDDVAPGRRARRVDPHKAARLAHVLATFHARPYDQKPRNRCEDGHSWCAVADPSWGAGSLSCPLCLGPALDADGRPLWTRERPDPRHRLTGYARATTSTSPSAPRAPGVQVVGHPSKTERLPPRVQRGPERAPVQVDAPTRKPEHPARPPVVSASIVSKKPEPTLRGPAPSAAERAEQQRRVLEAIAFVSAGASPVVSTPEHHEPEVVHATVGTPLAPLNTRAPERPDPGYLTPEEAVLETAELLETPGSFASRFDALDDGDGVPLAAFLAMLRPTAPPSKIKRPRGQRRPAAARVVPVSPAAAAMAERVTALVLAELMPRILDELVPLLLDRAIAARRAPRSRR
jgi:hypothetical protein